MMMMMMTMIMLVKVVLRVVVDCSTIMIMLLVLFIRHGASFSEEEKVRQCKSHKTRQAFGVSLSLLHPLLLRPFFLFSLKRNSLPFDISFP